MTLRFLKSDSTDRQLMAWLEKFSYHIGENSVYNRQYREKKFDDENPHLNYGVIQDTVRYIVYKARKNYGPRPQNNKCRW